MRAKTLVKKTMAEAFAKLGDSIYFHDDAGIYVNLFVASELRWPEKGVHLVQDTQFPRSETVRMTMQTEKPLRLPLRIRVPYWAEGASAALNENALLRAPEGTMLLLTNSVD